MLYLGKNLPQTLLDGAVSDEAARLRTEIFRFASELLRKRSEQIPGASESFSPTGRNSSA